MRTQMLAKTSSNLLQRTGNDHQGCHAQPGWRTFMMTRLRWILGYMRLEIWCKIGLSGDWCLCIVLRTCSSACYYWIGYKASFIWWPKCLVTLLNLEALYKQTYLSIYLSIRHKNTEYRRQYLDLAVFLHHLTFRALRILLLLLQLVTNLPVNFQHVLITTQWQLPSVLWHCWLGVRKSIRPVNIEWWGVGVVTFLEWGADCLHVIQLMPLPFENPIASCLI